MSILAPCRTAERFIYQSNATVLSGHVHRPTDLQLDVTGASALPITGGISSTTMGPTDIGGIVGFDWATTHAQGADHESKATRRSAKAADPTSQAHAGAEVRGLRVGSGRTRMTAARVRAELTALCSCHATQPSIGAMDGASFEGVAFGPHTLSIAIDRVFFREHDTHDKLCAACRDLKPAASRTVVAAFDAHNDEVPAALQTSIVKSIRWTGRPFPKATIDRHVVSVPGFGQVAFGELMVTGATRRLTMLRFSLDAAILLHGACCEVEAGGTWHR